MTTAANNMTQDISPRDAEVASSERDRIEQETERLQSEIAALKRLQKLKREEEELKRWLSGDRGNDNEQLQRNSSLMCESFDSGASSYPSPSSSPSRSGGLKKRGAPTSSGNSIGGYAKDKYDTMKKRFSSQSQGKKDDGDGDGDGDRGDVETQYPSRSVSLLDNKYGNNGKTTSRKVRTNKRGASGSAGSIPARILFRKIAMAILTNLDDETLQREDTEVILIIITLLKEAMLGILIAFVAVSVCLFIDHRFLLHLPTARNFRRATFAVMNDKETLRNVEENAGLKFMDMDEYDSMVSEIEKAENKTKLAESIFEKRGDDLIDMEKEKLQIERDHEQELVSLGLDKFCGDCKWGEGKATCQWRVDMMKDKYETPKYQAMMSVMQNGRCGHTGREIQAMQQHHPQHIPQHRQPPPGQQQLVQAVQWQPPSKQQVEKMALFKFLVYGKEQEQNNNAHPNRAPRSSDKPNLDDFCGGCKWGDGMTCGKQTFRLNEKFGTPIVEAMELVMVKEQKCTNAYYVDSISSLGGFCGECVWGHEQSQTCQARVEYLMYTYSRPLHEAQLTAMDKPVCRR